MIDSAELAHMRADTMGAKAKCAWHINDILSLIDALEKARGEAEHMRRHRDQARADLSAKTIKIADLAEELEKARAVDWEHLCKLSEEENVTVRAERDSALEDYRALKESYDTLINCAAIHRGQRDSARALLREAAHEMGRCGMLSPIRGRIATMLGM